MEIYIIATSVITVVLLVIGMTDELLYEAFGAIQFKGTFAATGKVDVENNLPRINVEGVGRLSWPIHTHQIEQLKNVMEKAPFGKGSELVYDEKVRKALHIDSSKIKVDNSFDKLVGIVAAQLGLECSIEARLHKLVLYEEGGTFDWHQDTEKSKGMFGSLVIHLPSYHEGGELLIRHEGTLIKSINNQQEGEDGFYYTAFYSDCFHKVNPISKGHRFTLLYDLLVKNTSNTISITNANQKAKMILDNFINTVRNEAKGEDTKPRFVFRLDHKYSDTNRNLLKGRDREKLSLLQNMKDENGNDLFFIALGHAKRKSSGYESDEDDWEYEDEATITTYLPHSLFNEPDDFSFTLTDEETEDLFSSPYRTESDGYQGNAPATVEHWYKESFAMIWLTEHHFSMVSPHYDITDEICRLVKTHPAYGKKYLDEFIKSGNNFEEAVAQSTLILRDKDHFLGAIACEAPLNTNRFYKTISDAIESELVTWDEVIPQIARFMGKFDESQAKFFSAIKDENIKLTFFNEIKKSASFKSTGLQNWIDAHKEVNMSIDYLFENISLKEDDWNIELFGYCLHDDQLLPKALEFGKYFSTKLLTLYNSNMKSFCDKVVLYFIKLNDIECLRKLTEFLLCLAPTKQASTNTYWYLSNRTKDQNEIAWDNIVAHKESCQLIPYIFDIIKQKTSTFLNIETSTLCIIFKLMIQCNVQKTFKTTKIHYNLLFNRLNLANVLSVYRYERKMLQVFASRIIQVGDESNLVSLVNQVIESDDWRTAVKSCAWTKSFSNILCDSFLKTGMRFQREFVTICTRLIRSNIDTSRLESLLFHCSTKGMDVVMKITEAILVCGRADECSLYLFVANYLLKNLVEFNEVECNFLYIQFMFMGLGSDWFIFRREIIFGNVF